jgi:creatinine amidohydrolase
LERHFFLITFINAALLALLICKLLYMSNMTTILEQAHWGAVKNQNVQVAVLPWGATEPHNYHLPYGTDTIQAAHIAIKSAELATQKGAKVMVLPAVPWGVNTGQTDLKLCLNIMPSTQLILLSDLADNLIRHKINKLVILNSHGGNDFIPLIRELSVRKPELFICTIDWWKVCNATEFFTEPGDHAGELETSVMLAIAPQLVLPLSEAGDGHSRRFAIKGFQQKWAWAQRQWTEISESTGVGNPVHATAAKGENYLTDSIEQIASFLTDLANADLNNMYESC